MTKLEYLYELKKEQLISLPYRDVLELKIMKGEALHKRLILEHNIKIESNILYDNLFKLRKRIELVEEAIKRTKDLLKELENENM